MLHTKTLLLQGCHSQGKVREIREFEITGYCSFHKIYFFYLKGNDVQGLSDEIVQAHLPSDLRLLLNERIFSLVSKFFPSRMTPNL